MVSPSELDTSVFKSPTPTEMSENQNQKAATDTGKLCLTTQDANSSDGDAGANRNNEIHVAPANKDQTVINEHPMEVGVAEADASKSTLDRQDTISDESQAPTVLSSQDSRTSNSSPRMCLSLKKVKVTSSGARQSLNMGTAEDKNPLETSAQFVLGLGANEGDMDSSVESQFHLPVVEVPNDSQFELSGDSQTLFQIQNPASTEPSSAEAPISSSHHKQPEKRGNLSSTLFAFVNPAQSSRQAIKKAKESNPTGTLSSPAQEIVPNQSSHNDPYAYDSQNVDTEVDFIMQRKAKRAACGPNMKKGPNVVSESHCTAQNASEQGDHKEDVAPENVAVFSSEPPSLNTADIRRPQIHQPPSRTLPHEGGGQSATSRPDSQDHQIQGAAGNRETVSSGSQPRAIVSQSPFVSPAIVLPSTSSAGVLPSISPSAAVPSSLVDELKKRAGLERGGDYQLKLVKVVRTIVEERHVFAEEVRQGCVVQDSERSWIVSQNITVI